jgi:hypothetical protein
VFHPISVSPYLVPLPPGDDPIAVTVIIIIIIIIIISTGTGTGGQLIAVISSVLSITPHHETKKKLNTATIVKRIPRVEAG